MISNFIEQLCLPWISPKTVPDLVLLGLCCWLGGFFCEELSLNLQAAGGKVSKRFVTALDFDLAGVEHLTSALPDGAAGADFVDFGSYRGKKTCLPLRLWRWLQFPFFETEEVVWMPTSLRSKTFPTRTTSWMAFLELQHPEGKDVRELFWNV